MQPEFIPTTDALRTIFLDEHNQRQNTLALGQLGTAGGPFFGKRSARSPETVSKTYTSMVDIETGVIIIFRLICENVRYISLVVCCNFSLDNR